MLWKPCRCLGMSQSASAESERIDFGVPGHDVIDRVGLCSVHQQHSSTHGLKGAQYAELRQEVQRPYQGAESTSASSKKSVCR